MKKWMVITSLAIASLATAAGHLSAAELSEQGCQEILMAQIKQAIEDEDEETANVLLGMEIMARRMPENEFAVAAKKNYCEGLKIAMEIYGLKENSPEWHEWIDWISELDTKIETDAVSAMSALVGRIKAEVEHNWVKPSSSIVGLKATIRVNLSVKGDVLSVNVVKSSGNQFFDRSAEIAIKKASPLPFPSNPDFYEHINVINLEFNPDDY